MAQEVYSGKSCEQRIADRLKNSGGEGATHHVQVGTGPTRVHHNIHEKGAQHNHVSGKMADRDVEYTKGQRG
jgi:hypothetical protein